MCRTLALYFIGDTPEGKYVAVQERKNGMASRYVQIRLFLPIKK